MSRHKPKDTDYLFISSYLRALEGSMLTRERRERMLEARSDEEAAKVLAECGFEGLEPLSAQALEASLRNVRAQTFAELSELAPDPRIIELFRIPYDYHNAKALIKCAASGQNPERMLMDEGRVPAAELAEAIGQDALDALPQALREAVAKAKKALEDTGDPQYCDFALDSAYYSELQAMAKDLGSSFMEEYVRLLIDGANLKSAVRAIRMKKDQAFLNEVLAEGGSVDRSIISAAAATGGSLQAVFTGPYQEAAALGDQISSGGSQTAFERACDNVPAQSLKSSRMVPFGDSVLISYVAARENDITAARIIMSGRLSGVPTESIRERLRESYV